MAQCQEQCHLTFYFFSDVFPKIFIFDGSKWKGKAHCLHIRGTNLSINPFHAHFDPFSIYFFFNIQREVLRSKNEKTEAVMRVSFLLSFSYLLSTSLSLLSLTPLSNHSFLISSASFFFLSFSPSL